MDFKEVSRVVQSRAAAGAPVAAARSRRECSVGPHGVGSPADGRTHPLVALDHATSKYHLC